MPRVCTVCRHPEAAIIASLLASGTPYRNLVERFGLSLGTLNRHLPHIVPVLEKVIEKRQSDEAESCDEALERITRDQRRRTATLDEQNNPLGASKVAKAEADIHLRLKELTAPSVSVQ